MLVDKSPIWHDGNRTPIAKENLYPEPPGRRRHTTNPFELLMTRSRADRSTREPKVGINDDQVGVKGGMRDLRQRDVAVGVASLG